MNDEQLVEYVSRHGTRTIEVRVGKLVGYVFEWDATMQICNCTHLILSDTANTLPTSPREVEIENVLTYLGDIIGVAKEAAIDFHNRKVNAATK